jgi:hypothetical protein
MRPSIPLVSKAIEFAEAVVDKAWFKKWSRHSHRPELKQSARVAPGGWRFFTLVIHVYRDLQSQ